MNNTISNSNNPPIIHNNNTLASKCNNIFGINKKDRWFVSASKIGFIILFFNFFPMIGLTFLVLTLSYKCWNIIKPKTANKNIVLLNNNLPGINIVLNQEKNNRKCSILPPPIGIKNSSAFCYFNSGIQLILNHPGFSDAVIQMRKKNLPFNTFVEVYGEAQKNNIPLKTNEGSPFYRYFIHLQKKYSSDLKEVGDQGDVNKVFDAFFKELDEYSIESPLKKQEIINNNTLDRYGPDIFAGADTNENFGEEYRNQRIFTDENNKEQVIQFSKPPEYFLFQLNTNKNEQFGGFSMTLSSDLFQSNEEAHYEAAYFSVFMGNGQSGHYMCLLKQKDTWYLINDGYVDVVSFDEVKEIVNKEQILTVLYELES